MAKEILRMVNICKSFPGVRALDQVSISCKEGEVLILAGENGAGKSTLLKILTGFYHADCGEIYFRGEKVQIKEPKQAQQLRIAMVYQELTLIPQLTVAENIYLNIEPTGKLGLIKRKELKRKLQEIMDQYDIRIDPDIRVDRLSVAKQQLAEILKILVRDPELIILDEPTSALSQEEVKKLFEVIRSLTRRGKAIIFISHRMKENFEIGDQITVLKDGTHVATRPAGETTEDELVRLMVGRPLQNIFPAHSETISEEIAFEVKNMNCKAILRDVSFAVRRGEILGIAGLAGHGQSELLNAISGLLPGGVTGEILIDGKPVSVKNAKQAIKNGIALVPTDRKTQGLMLMLSVEHNLTISSLEKRQKAAWIDRKAEKQFAQQSIEALSIKVSSPKTTVSNLSGGNQQKVVLGKELGIGPRVLLFDEPTRGIDVEAKSEFYRLIRRQADQGTTVIINSSDLMEVIGLSDRVAVMFEGRIQDILEGDELEEETIMRCAMGLGKERTNEA